MYIPDIGLFYETKGEKKAKSINELLVTAVPVQEEITVEDSDINKPFMIKHDLRVFCEVKRGFAEPWGVLGVFSGGRQKAAARVKLPPKLSTAVAKEKRVRHNRIWFPAAIKEPAKMYITAGGDIAIREFRVFVMGALLEGVIYREWWKIDENDAKSAALERMEIGCGISDGFFGKQPRLRLD